MSPPDSVLKLVERFDRNLDAYRSGSYNETQLRREFVDPLFEALGWDVHNRQGWAEAYKEVVHEDAVRIGGTVKAPDYAFRIGGVRKFFVETKKPSVLIREEIPPAFQLRRYAWSAKLPLSILTDFEEFAVYDTRIKPEKTDRASKARTLYLRYTEYAERWSEIASVFGRDAILQGSFDRYAESNRRKRGTADVDDAFLGEIEGWRESLARNLALRNPSLSQRQLNFAVQRTLDRIIFLRIAEDRGIEEYGRLQALLNGANVYARLQQLFTRADERYNSGLFHFRAERGRDEPPDDLTPGLTIDDKPLKQILGSLYYPESPYEFSVLPADILGQVYERFLGKVIRLTAGHRAVVEEKPEVRKAGGVYYTPTYIVDYIVRNTVGKLVEDLKPGPRGGVSKLRVLDPACGSGSFLLGAYQFLLDWHLERYAEEPERWREVLVEAPGGGWRLTTAERKRILLNNIYGVDIDPQAVEVTKLSLLLKVLEGENEQTLTRQMALFHERALPDLADNIKSGNSLIGPDFYDGKQLGLLDEEERWRVNAFDWDAEFPEIIRGGGFDAVIGNPPYLNLKRGFLGDREKEYFAQHYATAQGQYDAFALFSEKAVSLLTVAGVHAYIIPKPVLVSESYEPLRRRFFENTIRIVADSGSAFPGVGVETAIVVVQRGAPSRDHEVAMERVPRLGVPEQIGRARQRVYCDLPFCALSYLLDSPMLNLIETLQQRGQPLGSIIALFTRGIEAGKRDLQIGMNPENGSVPLLRGEDVNRYTGSLAAVFYTPLASEQRKWKSRELYDVEEKILIRRVANEIIGTIDRAQHWVLNTIYVLVPEEPYAAGYVLGLLNSRLLSVYFRAVFLSDDKLFPYLRISQLETLPIRSIDFSAPPDAARHDRMVALVEQMLGLHEQLAAARTAHDKTLIERQIKTTDRQIDRLVYELYGLTDEEIAVVEGTGETAGS